MQTLEKTHPAAEWALGRRFNALEVDCTTTVVLKILDGKCKMLPGEKAAIMQIYDVVRSQSGDLFDDGVHRSIDAARAGMEPAVASRIHELRVQAEELIPKPVMKQYKAMLRNGLFGE